MSDGPAPDVYVLDDDADLAAAVARCIRSAGYSAQSCNDPLVLIEKFSAAQSACVVSDVMMAPMDGFSLVARLRKIQPAISVIFMTAWPKVADAVDAIRDLGGIDYLAKPIDEVRLIAAVEKAVRVGRKAQTCTKVLSRLTLREREVFDLLVAGYASKAIASQLKISPRTVDDHRAKICAKLGTGNLPELVAMHRAAEKGVR